MLSADGSPVKQVALSEIRVTPSAWPRSRFDVERAVWLEGAISAISAGEAQR
jgi:hypothetical protein